VPFGRGRPADKLPLPVSTTDPNSPTDPTASSLHGLGRQTAGCYRVSRKLDVGVAQRCGWAHDEVAGQGCLPSFHPEAIRKDTRALRNCWQDIKRNGSSSTRISAVYDLVEEPDWVAISMDTFGENRSARVLIGRDRPGLLGEISHGPTPRAKRSRSAQDQCLHRDLTPANLFLSPPAAPRRKFRASAARSPTARPGPGLERCPPSLTRAPNCSRQSANAERMTSIPWGHSISRLTGSRLSWSGPHTKK